MYANPKTFSKRFKIAMIEREFSNEALAQAMNVSIDTIYRYGKELLPTTDNLVNLADCLNVSIDFLLGRKDTMKI